MNKWKASGKPNRGCSSRLVGITPNTVRQYSNSTAVYRMMQRTVCQRWGKVKALTIKKNTPPMTDMQVGRSVFLPQRGMAIKKNSAAMVGMIK